MSAARTRTRPRCLQRAGAAPSSSPRPRRRGAGGRGCQLRRPPRHDRRPRGRIRLGQDHRRPLRAAARRADRGRVVFDGVDLRRCRTRDMRAYRRRMQIVFQDPYSSLNPRLRVDGHHRRGDRHARARQRRARRDRIAELLRAWSACNPEHARRYPARILRRPAPAHRHRPGTRGRAGVHRGGRAGLGAGRLGAGAGAQPDPGPAEELRADACCSSRTISRWSSISATRWW